ncbi:MAG TPA: ester cyclase [Myxococcaceae bacterium]|nr:ester cyclase [Myxococcaceae bacterium]
MATDNLAMGRRIVEEIWNQGKLEVSDELFAKSYINHIVGYPKPLRGPEGYRQLVRSYREALPDLRHGIDELHAIGDRLIMRWTVVGTHKGEIMGVAPTGRRISVSGINIYRIANGQVQEEWCYWDFATFMAQIGLTFQPAATVAPQVAPEATAHM